MKIKQLVKVCEIKIGQFITINDGRNYRRYDSEEGWDFGEDVDREQLFGMTVDGFDFSGERLTIWAH